MKNNSFHYFFTIYPTMSYIISPALQDSTMSGQEFNATHKGPFYKFLNDNLKHYKHTYASGENRDHIPFNPSGRGGLYFTDDVNMSDWMFAFGLKMAYVEVPDDAKVYIGFGKFKADYFVLSDIINIADMHEWKDVAFCMKMVSKDVRAFKYAKCQTMEMCQIAVQRDGMELKNIINQTEELCLTAVQQNSFALQYVVNQTDKICLAAVQRNGFALEHVVNQTDEICLAAVKRTAYAMQYVRDASRVQSLCLQYTHLLPHVRHLTPELCMAVVKQNPPSIRHIRSPTLAMCMVAVSHNGLLLECFACNSFEVYLKAVQQNGHALQYVNDEIGSYDKLCIAAFEQNKESVKYIANKNLRLYIIHKLYL